MRITRGADSGSAEKRVEKHRLFSLFCPKRLIEIRLIRRLWVVILIHTFLLVESQVRGSIISEGAIIFNIAGGSGFVQSQSHMCLRFLQAGLVLRLLRRRQTLKLQLELGI